MRASIICATFLSAASAYSFDVAPSEEKFWSMLTGVSQKNSRYSNYLYRTYCESSRGLDVREVSAPCLNHLFCENRQEDFSAECNIQGKVEFNRQESHEMSSKCFEQAVCNVIKHRGGEKENGSAKGRDAQGKKEVVKDVILPFQFAYNNTHDEFSVPCSDFTGREEKWTYISFNCVYYAMCTNPKPEYEPECTSLDPNKKEYSYDDLFDLPNECMRELVCNRAKLRTNPVVGL